MKKNFLFRCITYDGEAGQLRSGTDMIEIDYRWRAGGERTWKFRRKEGNMGKDKEGWPTTSSLLRIKVLCDRKAKDHDEILK